MKHIKLTKEEKSWTLYDMSSSAITLMLTAIIPIYLKSVGTNAGFSDAASTAHWGVINSVSALILAIAAPVIGAIADFRGNKNRLFNVFFTVGVVSLFATVFLDNYLVLLIVNLVMILGYMGTYVVYDAFLVDVSPDERMDYVSSAGYSIGYIGSCIPFIISIALIMFEPLGLKGALAVKASLALNGVWWLLLTLPFLKNVRQKYYIEKTSHNIAASVKNVAVTFKKLRSIRSWASFCSPTFFILTA